MTQLIPLEVNSASSSGADSDAISKQLRSLSNQIDGAHDAIQTNNSSQVLRYLNSADNQLLKIVANMSSAADDAPEEED